MGILRNWQITGCIVVQRLQAPLAKMELFWSVFWTRTGSERLVGPFQKILTEDHMYYNHYAIESAFKKAMNLDTMAVVHFAISACKQRRAEFSAGMNVAEHIKLSKLDGHLG